MSDDTRRTTLGDWGSGGVKTGLEPSGEDEQVDGDPEGVST